MFFVKKETLSENYIVPQLVICEDPYIVRVVFWLVYPHVSIKAEPPPPSRTAHQPTGPSLLSSMASCCPHHQPATLPIYVHLDAGRPPEPASSQTRRLEAAVLIQDRLEYGGFRNSSQAASLWCGGEQLGILPVGGKSSARSFQGRRLSVVNGLG